MMIRNNLLLVLVILLLTSCNSIVVFTWNIRDMIAIGFIVIVLLMFVFLWILMMFNKVFRNKRKHDNRHPTPYL